VSRAVTLSRISESATDSGEMLDRKIDRCIIPILGICYFFYVGRNESTFGLSIV
jgi:hypothetical protein